MANKIFSTADAVVTAAGAGIRHLGCPIEVEPGWILQFGAQGSSIVILDYPVDVTTGAIGTQTSAFVAGVTAQNGGLILTKSVMFDATHMLTVFQDATSGNVNAVIFEWDPAAHTLTSTTVTDLGITGGGYGMNFEQIDATHYLISYDFTSILIQQVIEVNAGTYAVTTVGTPLTTAMGAGIAQSHVVQIDATHYSVSFTKIAAGTGSGWFMIVEVNLGTWAVTTATAVTALGSGAGANAYHTSYYIDSLTWTFKISATKVVVFYTTKPGTPILLCYRVVDINTGTWVITIGALEVFGGASATYMDAAYLTQPDLTVAEAHYSGNTRSYKGQSMWKIGFDVAQDKVTVLSNAFNTWTSGSLIRYTPMGQVTELTGGDILVMSYMVNSAALPQLHSIFNTDSPATSGAIEPVASALTPRFGGIAQFPDVVALDSTHFVVLGSTTTQDFITYLVNAAGQIELLDYSFATSYDESVSGVKLDSTHLLLSTDQYKFRVAEVDANYIGSWSAVETTLSSGGTDTDNGVKMYVAGEDVTNWYVIVNRYSTGTTTAVSVVSINKTTYVVAQVGTDLTGMGTTANGGYDMTPVEGYTDKWVCIYTDTNIKAIVVGVNGSFEPVLEGAELDLGIARTYGVIQSVDATHFIIAYDDGANGGWAETLEVNVGTWALSVASAAAFNFETLIFENYKTNMVKVDSEHVAIIYGKLSSEGYVIYESQGTFTVLEMDAATYNITAPQKIELISYWGRNSALSLLDTDTLISVTSTDNIAFATLTNNVQLWDVVVGGATQVTITGAGADFVAGSSTTLEVEVQDGAGVVDGADNTTRITFTPASQGQITGTVTGTNISGTGAVGNPRVVEVVAGVAKVTVENTTAETFTIAITNDGGLADPADDSIIVSAAAASAVALTTPAPDFIASATSNQTIQIQDTYGNLVTTDSTTRITYTPTLSGAATAVVVGTNISGTGLPGDPRVVEVAGGISTITLADTVAETFEVAFANDGAFSNPANDSIVVTAAAATKVSLTGAGADFTVGGSTTVSVQIQDTYNNLIITDSTTRVTLTPTLAGQISGVTVGVNISGTGAAGAPRVVEVAGGIAAVTVTNLVIQTFEIAFINDGGYSNPANDSIDSLAAGGDGPGVMVGFNF